MSNVVMQQVEKRNGRLARRRFQTIRGSSRCVTIVMSLFLALSLFGPLNLAPTIAQDEVPADVVAEAPVEVPVETAPVVEPVLVEESQPVEVAQPLPGSLEVQLTSGGVRLSGLFAVSDASGAYQERWTDGGVAWFSDLAAGTATVWQLSGTADYAFDSSTPAYIDVPAGGHAALPIMNPFLDADGDGVGDSVDSCGAGNDAVDTDVDGSPDACDGTPNGDDDNDGVDNAEDACPLGDDTVDTDIDGLPDACEDMTESAPSASPTAEQTSEISVDVASEPVVVDAAPVTCQQADAGAPWIATDLADYPPGSLVTLTGGNWVAGQVIELQVEDDGIADAEHGSWSHYTTVTADGQGSFSYQFTLAPWYVADYSVVATGECSAASTTFTDAFVLSASLNPMQVQYSSPITYSMTVANSNTGNEATDTVDNNLGCVRIALPTNGANGYTAPIVAQSVFAPGGKSWSVATFNSNSATMYIIATANNTASKLAPNEQLTIGFSAKTPANVGLSPITVTGRTSTNSPCDAGLAGFNLLTFDVNVVGASYAAAASITPSIVGVSAPQTYTVRVTNNGGDSMNSVKILVPAGFSAPTGLSFSGSGFNSGNPIWSMTYSSTDGKILVNSGNVNGRLNAGGYIDVTFTSTAPVSAGPRTVTVEAWAGIGFSGNQFGFASQPVVTVVQPTTTTTVLTRNPNQSTAFGVSVTFTATVTPASGSISGGTVTFRDGATVLCNAAVLSGTTATCTTTSLTVGTHSLTATYSGTTTGNPLFGTSTSSPLSHAVTQITQTITFAPLANKTFGDPPFAVAATATSGLAVTFTAGGSCTVAGTQVTLTSAGACTITAAQSGNTNYAPAASVLQTFQIGEANCVKTASASGGNLNFGSSSWTGTSYPVMTGGLSILIGSSGVGCKAWSIQASTSALTGSNGGTIPGQNISYTGTSAGAPPAGLTPGAGIALGGSPQVIANGTATTTTGTWNVAFSLTPPATAIPGSYQGTITITVPSAST